MSIIPPARAVSRPDGVEITTTHAATWAERYFAAWRTNAAEDVEALFAEDVVYFYGPFRPPAVGRDEVVRRWTEGGRQDMTSHHEVVAVAGDTAVIHWSVSMRDRSLDGVLIVRFDEQGRCREHREWYAERC